MKRATSLALPVIVAVLTVAEPYSMHAVPCPSESTRAPRDAEVEDALRYVELLPPLSTEPMVMVDLGVRLGHQQEVVVVSPSATGHEVLSIYLEAIAVRLRNANNSESESDSRHFYILTAEALVEAAKISSDLTEVMRFELTAARVFEIGGDWERMRYYRGKWPALMPRDVKMRSE